MNVAYTSKQLRLSHTEWDYTSPKPQVDGYKAYLKAELAAGHPVVFFPMCKGDSHIPYPGSGPNGGKFDHVEVSICRHSRKHQLRMYACVASTHHWITPGWCQ